MTLYNDIFTELYGEDREAAISVVDDDEKFDAWFKKYQDNQKAKSRSPKHSSPKGKAVSKDEYFSRTSGRLPKPKVKKNAD